MREDAESVSDEANLEVRFVMNIETNLTLEEVAMGAPSQKRDRKRRTNMERAGSVLVHIYTT